MEFIKKPIVLWGLFIGAVVLMAGFVVWVPLIGGTGLDSVIAVDEVQSILLGMSDVQKNSHILMTLVLDMAYPFVYGLLFAGLILKFAGKPGIWLSIPAFAVIPVDICENLIQLMALSGNVSLLSVKAILTPVKFLLFFLSLLLAVGSLIFGVVKKN